MRRRFVMLMLGYVGRQLWVDNPAERHKPECDPYDDNVSNATRHRSLPQSRCFHRLLFLNPRDDFIDLLFGEQATFEVFLYAPLLIDKDAHG